MKHASKKIVALLAMLTLVLSMFVQTGFAAGTIGPNDGGRVETTDTTLNIVKTLTVKNPALIEVAGPGLQYSFSVEPANIGQNPIVVTDRDGHTATVHQGPSGGLTLTSSPEFAVGDMLTASAAGTDNTRYIVLEAHLDQFTEPGIYRYALTDNTDDAVLAAAGVERVDDYTDVRFVDVYIQVTGTGLAVEGFVVGSDNDGNGVLFKETFDTSTTTDDTTDPDYNHYDTRDKFDTYNLQLNKTVTGAMGDKNHQFPFAITISENDREFYTAKGIAPSSSSELSTQTGSLSTTLKDGETYYIAGLRKNTTVVYTETNNTTDTYKTSITGGTASAASAVSPGNSKSMAQTVAPSAGNVTFVNNHESVSPTGVIMRYGPYLGMVLVAALLIMMRKRAKTH